MNCLIHVPLDPLLVNTYCERTNFETYYQFAMSKDQPAVGILFMLREGGVIYNEGYKVDPW